MKRWGYLVWLAMCLAPAGCESGSDGPLRPPGGPPYICGVITAVERDRVVIEENPREQSGSNKASLRVTNETVLRFRASGQPASFADLRVGRRAQAWTTGPIAESYPVQATAARIEIE